MFSRFTIRNLIIMKEKRIRSIEISILRNKSCNRDMDLLNNFVFAIKIFQKNHHNTIYKTNND